MSRDERIVIRIGGDMSGQFVLGDNNVTTNSSAALSEADRKLLTALFDELGGQLDGQDELADPRRAGASQRSSDGTSADDSVLLGRVL